MCAKVKKPPRALKKEDLYEDMALLLTTGKPGKNTIKAILSAIEKRVNISAKLLYLAEGTEGNFVSFPSLGSKKRTMIGESKNSLAALVRHSKRHIVLPDASKSPDYSPRVDLPLKKNERAVAVFPLKMGDSLAGVLEVRGKSFSAKDIKTLNSISRFLAMACIHSLNMERIEELTITDELTGLYNARYLTRLLEMEVRRSERYEGIFSVIFIDIDNFKKVNDKHGHLVGSRVLQEIGKLLGNSIRSEIDSGFRYGGDEFVLLLPNTNRGGAAVVARRLQYLLKSRTFRDDEGKAFHVTASFGIAEFPHDAQTRAEILKIADEAMYRVKGMGRDGICISLEGAGQNQP